LTLIRIFELYSIGNLTFEMLADQLEAEGHFYRDSQPRFGRTSLSYILNNHFYIGELHRNGQIFEGKYRRLIDRAVFEACQDVSERTGIAGPGILIFPTLEDCSSVLTVARRLQENSSNEN
jgi:hypothetical protein